MLSTFELDKEANARLVVAPPADVDGAMNARVGAGGDGALGVVWSVDVDGGAGLLSAGGGAGSGTRESEEASAASVSVEVTMGPGLWEK